MSPAGNPLGRSVKAGNGLSWRAAADSQLLEIKAMRDYEAFVSHNASCTIQACRKLLRVSWPN